MTLYSFHSIKLLIGLLLISLSACGSIYRSPSIIPGETAGLQVAIVSITVDTVVDANRVPYQPKPLPSDMLAFGSAHQSAPSLSSLVTPGFGTQPVREILPPEPAPDMGYSLGVGDVLRLTRSGLIVGALAAEASQTTLLTIQDDGSVTLAELGRIKVAGFDITTAEHALITEMVKAGLSPSISLDIADYRAHSVTVDGAVRSPVVLPVTMVPLYLDAALAQAGGADNGDAGAAWIFIYRGGHRYVLRATSDPAHNPRLLSGDRVEVVREGAQEAAVAQAELSQRAAQVTLAGAEADRERFQLAQSLGAVPQDHVYLAGEVGQQRRLALPYARVATLADALFADGAGLPTETADISQIYVLRSGSGTTGNEAITAWHLDIRNAARLTLATQFELRPNDVIFVAEQPVTRWGRVVNQISPSLITTPYPDIAH